MFLVFAFFFWLGINENKRVLFIIYYLTAKDSVFLGIYILDFLVVICLLVSLEDRFQIRQLGP